MTVNFAKQALIIGIWGRGGGSDSSDSDNGIAHWISRLRPKFVELGVPSDHIWSMGWNPNEWANEDPLGKPDTKKHLKILYKQEPSPSYVALIGHSFGGWAVCRLSRKLNVQPNFIALIDPVFGPHGDDEKIIKPRGDNIHNWYQRNAIVVSSLEDCVGTVVGCAGGVSCGRKINGVHNHKKVKYQRDWEGRKRKRKCDALVTSYKMPKFISHTTIDSDAHIWRQIFEQIETDIKKLSG